MLNGRFLTNSTLHVLLGTHTSTADKTEVVNARGLARAWWRGTHMCVVCVS